MSSDRLMFLNTGFEFWGLDLFDEGLIRQVMKGIAQTSISRINIDLALSRKIFTKTL
jgi:hypothetical protein